MRRECFCETTTSRNCRSAFVHRPFSGALLVRWFLRRGARANLTRSVLSWQQPPIRIRGVSFPATTASRPYHSRNLWPQSLTPALVQYGTSLCVACIPHIRNVVEPPWSLVYPKRQRNLNVYRQFSFQADVDLPCIFLEKGTSIYSDKVRTLRNCLCVRFIGSPLTHTPMVRDDRYFRLLPNALCELTCCYLGSSSSPL